MTFGLGGNATEMIASKFGLNGLTITAEILPPMGGGSGIPFALPLNDPIQTVRITVMYKGKSWVRIFKFSRFGIQAIISIRSIFATVTTKFTIAVTKMRKAINIMRLKR